MDAPNPWLSIPATDYEGHMNNPEVGQLEFLNKLFREILLKYSPGSLAVLGCATGNGFDYIDLRVTKKIIAIDINPEYTKILMNRFQHLKEILKVVCTDINEYEFGNHKFDLVHCALIFEYVDVENVVGKIKKVLSNNGKMTVLLQLPHNSAQPVSETAYSSLKRLKNFMKLVSPEKFKDIAQHRGLQLESEAVKKSGSGKQFWFAVYSNN